MSNSYQRAKAKVKELQAQNEDLIVKNEVLTFDISVYKERNKLLNHILELSEKDVNSKNQIIQSQKNVIKVIVAISLVLTAGIVALSSIM